MDVSEDNQQSEEFKLFEMKKKLRKVLNERINSLTEEEISQQSDAVTRKVLRHDKYKRAENVSIYLSYDKEVQTENILKDIFLRGKKCFVPRYFKDSPMEMVRLTSLEDYENLPRNRWNIKQPPKDDDRENVFDTGKLDLIIMPGLGFTKDGKRLGRGKGYYDSFLMRCSSLLLSQPYTIGLSFSEQLEPDLPMTDKDVFINEVIYP